MADAVKSADNKSALLGCALFIGMFALAGGAILGMTAFSLWVFKWTFPAYAITIGACLFILAPLAFFPKTQGTSAIGFLIAAYAFHLILWVWSMAYTYSIWGMTGVIIGLILAGVGVVPVAMLAALLHGEWGNLGLFVLSFIMSGLARTAAHKLAQACDRRAGLSFDMPYGYQYPQSVD